MNAATELEPVTFSQPSEGNNGKTLLKHLARKTEGTCPGSLQDQTQLNERGGKTLQQRDLPVLPRVDWF